MSAPRAGGHEAAPGTPAGPAAGTGDRPGLRPGDLHDLRKRCKELRYLLEIFASVFEPQAYLRALKDLKGLQDCLGEFQDRQVQQQELREFADQMIASRAQSPAPVPATALLAMGELAGGIGRAQRRARTEFAGRFGEFASPASDRRFADLIASASQDRGAGR